MGIGYKRVNQVSSQRMGFSRVYVCSLEKEGSSKEALASTRRTRVWRALSTATLLCCHSRLPFLLLHHHLALGSMEDGTAIRSSRLAFLTYLHFLGIWARGGEERRWGVNNHATCVQGRVSGTMTDNHFHIASIFATTLTESNKATPAG